MWTRDYEISLHRVDTMKADYIESAYSSQHWGTTLINTKGGNFLKPNVKYIACNYDEGMGGGLV